MPSPVTISSAPAAETAMIRCAPRAASETSACVAVRAGHESRSGTRLVLQVVDRDHATEVAPCGREVRHRVQQLDAGPSSRHRHQRQLSERPLGSAARRHRDDHGAHPVTQLAGQPRSGVAIDERDELELGGALQQRRHEFARVGLTTPVSPGTR